MKMLQAKGGRVQEWRRGGRGGLKTLRRWEGKKKTAKCPFLEQVEGKERREETAL